MVLISKPDPKPASKAAIAKDDNAARDKSLAAEVDEALAKKAQPARAAKKVLKRIPIGNIAAVLVGTALLGQALGNLR